MKGVTKLNDPLGDGGYVNKASGSKFMGIPVASQGDTVVYILHKGVFPILDFEPTWTMDGKGVVVDGCRTVRGCAIKTILPTAGTGKQGNGEYQTKIPIKNQKNSRLILC